MTDVSDPASGNPSHFSDPQKSRILAGVSYMDKLLVDVEEILTAASSQAFPKYKNPLTPVQIRVARDYIKRLRQQITRVLSDLEIPLPTAKFDSTHAIRVTLQFIEVAIEEIAPERLSGYGKVPEVLTGRLAGGLQEMKGIVRQLDSYLVQRPDADLVQRAARLAGAGTTSELLSLLVSIVDRHGFVEFRIPLQQIVEKMEAPAYEIAFFGRVSAGKSSLLNRIIGTDLLPTGVTPITAVPTRIRNSPKPSLLVWTAEGNVNRYEIGRLAEFVTEAHNAANHKRVTRLIAEVPIPILPEEVVLVDTPGLGSLALEGAAETLAYLPQCDLGVVLVEASSNLHSDDVATVDALRAASIPSVVVLSKTDLVHSDDVERLVRYTDRQLSDQLGVAIPVTPLSSRPENGVGLKAWVEEQIAPRIANARSLADESNHRKAASLAERVLRALQMSIKAASFPEASQEASDLKEAEAKLRQAAGSVEQANTQCFRMTGQIRDAAPNAIEIVAEKALSIWGQKQSNEALGPEWIRGEINGIAQKASEELAAFVTSLAQKLSDALNSAAEATGGDKRSQRDSLEDFVKELPAPDFGACSVQLARPRALALSVSMARRSVKNRIESECSAALYEFFVSYGRALELWFRTVLGNMERAFNAAADVYRAQLQRLSEPATETRASKSSVVEDIVALQKALGTSEMIEDAEEHVTA